MNKLLKNILSIEVMSVLMLLMAFACAVATFVENDYGSLGAKSFVYGQTWFESIMTLLTLGVVANIIWFKMYTKKKFFIFLIHISLVFIFLGSALTRYMGYEGVMTIPENTVQDKMLSNSEYIQARLFKDGKEQTNIEHKVLMTQLSQTDFSLDIDSDINITFNRFVPNAAEKIVSRPNGKPMVNLIITNLGGAKSIDLSNNKIHEERYANFALNAPIEDNTKPKVHFFNKDGIVYIKSNVAVSYNFMTGVGQGSIKAQEALPLRDDVIYIVAQTRFATPDFAASGKVEVVSLKKDAVKKEKSVNAVVVDITNKGKTISIPLFGNGGSNRGYTKTLTLDDKRLVLQWGAKDITLPFSLYLNDFKMTRYPGSNSPSEYSSDVKVYDTKNDETFEYTIAMNNTLQYQGYKFFQSSYAMNETATVLSVNKDPGMVPTYIGYFLLFTGLILSLFTKNGRFQKLARKKYELKDISSAIILALLFISAPDANAKDKITDEQMKIVVNIDKTHAQKLGGVLIQDYQGRIKPINSLAIEIVNKVSRKNELYDLDANQIFASMMINPRAWQLLPIIKVKDEGVKDLLGIKKDAKYFSFGDVYTNFGSYKLEDQLEIANKKKPSARTTYDKDIIKIDERLNIVYNLFSGAFLKLFPKIEDKNNKWLDPTLAISVINDGTGALNEKEAKVIASMMDGYFIALKNANENNGSWEEANKALDVIINYQEKNASHIMPSSWKVQAELMFNKYNIFQRLTPLYLILGLILLGFVFAKIFNPRINLEKVTKIFLMFFAIGFVIHTFGLGLRWYVAGHAPWSNGYESMIYIAWAIILSGMIFSKQSILALATTSVLSGITLFVAHLSWLEPQITTLTPVLKSYWLTIHVSVITASYGFLGLSAFLGFITLFLYIIANKNKQNQRLESIKVSIKEARRINEMSMMIGLILLVIGNFLGGIWANESWGRYWGWDPKETWTLVSILIYAVILHLHYIKGLSTNFVFATLSLVAYSAIIMTYFGVNYYLAGMHSYAAGDPLPIPTFVPVTVVIVLITAILASRNRKII